MRLLLSIVLAIAGFAAGYAMTGRIGPAAAPEAAAVVDQVPEPVAEPAQVEAVAAAPAAGPAPQVINAPGPDFASIAEQAVRGVVNIASVQIVRQPNSPFANDPFFQYFFGDDIFGSRSRRSQSLGSGVIISSDGYVITNSHVVGASARAREVTVTLWDNREVPGTVIGADAATDLALLKIDVPDLTPVPWGDSSRLRVGEWVLAIGSPFQLSQTVTAGIVSATGRANVGFADYEDFIQTDAAINPGNSGGALINTRGQLIGINTGIFSQSGGYQGIGFAVPSILARRIADDLARYGEVRRGTIAGIVIDRLTPRAYQVLELPPSVTGVVIVQIAANSDAYAAGLRAGDVVVGFNGQPVSDPSQLFRLVSDAEIGSNGTLRVQRGDRQVDVTVPIAGPTPRR
jgi:Do/DeqQ family serine protease